MNSHDLIDEIIVRVLSGRFTVEELDSLIDWCGESAENSEYFMQMKKVWNLSFGVRLSEGEVEESLRELKARIRSLNRKFLPRYTGYAAAAVAAAVLVFAIVWTYGRKEAPVEKVAMEQSGYRPPFSGVSIVLADGTEIDMEAVSTDKAEPVRISDEMSVFADGVVYSADEKPKEDEAVRMNTLRVGRGKRYMATLSDGTKVWLNSGSTLTYPVSFDSGIRTVTMTGECFFDVPKDPQKPFIVEARGMEVEALGTSFNITCYENEEVASMTLSTGRVAVGTRAGSLMVEAGRRVEFDMATDRLSESAVDPADYSGWIDGRYKFTGATFGYVVARLELLYDVTIIDRSNIGDSVLFSGAFDDMDIESVIKSLTINTSTAYEYDAEKNIFTINP